VSRRQQVRNLPPGFVPAKDHADFEGNIAIVTVIQDHFFRDTFSSHQLAHQPVIIHVDITDQTVYGNSRLGIDGDAHQAAQSGGFPLSHLAAHHAAGGAGAQ